MFSLIIPTYDEAENIARCVDAVCRALEGRDFEIVVVDDDSPDRTWEIAQHLGNPKVRVLRRTGKRGLSAAVVEGFQTARGELLGVIDADLQHDETALPRMIDALADHEFVIGTRRARGGGTEGWPALRRLASRAAALAARIALGERITDPMTGFFALRREVFERARPLISARGFKICLEFCCLGRPRSIAEIGYVFRPRRAGKSKLSARVAVQYILTLIDLRRKTRRLPPPPQQETRPEG